jgi:hypothetical protein
MPPRKIAYRIALVDPMTRRDWEGVIEEDAADMRAGATAALREARKTFATHFVDYDNYDNDSAYLDDLEQVGGRFFVGSMRKEGDRRRFLVYGTYSDFPAGGAWSDHVEAVDDEDARFQAAWIMAMNEGADPNDKNFDSLADAFAGFLVDMDEIEITDCEEEPVSKDEALDLVRDLYALLAAGTGNRDAVLERAAAALAATGRPAPSAPSVVLDPEE